MAEPFDWKKAFDFSFPAIGKSVSVCLKAGAVIFAVWWLYGVLIKPHFNPVPNQKAEQMINNQNSPKATFGCAAVKLYMKEK
jgi:hypothetical protein